MVKNQDESAEFFGQMATADFDQAFRKSFFRSIFKKIQGKRSGLLSFDEVRKKLEIQNQIDRGIQEIPIDQIIGSLNRYQDFDDRFLPKQTRTRGKWERIDKLKLIGELLPPVEVYQLGDFYFVIDGNHRVSVAKEKGQKFTDAHVIELKLDFPIKGDFNWHEILLKQEKANFYEQTKLDQLRPEASINLTLAGQYAKLLDHIAVHRYYTSEYLRREVSFEEAVKSWYDYIYHPMVTVIRDKGILEHFPDRTEADLYLWIIEHLEYLKERYQKPVSFDEAADNFSQENVRNWLQTMAQAIRKGIVNILPTNKKE